MEAIETKRLTKFYGRARGIEDLDLTVHEGEIFGFIGPNGAGKSTTIRTLLGLIKKSGGEASVLGMDIEKEKGKLLREVGYLPSEAAFYSGMKVREVLEFSAKLRGRDCREEAKRLSERLGLDMARKVSELSLGNRKKVGIVAAMQHKPRLYILDEPTSGLDPLIQREFFSLLEERRAEGATVFLSSHVLSEIGRYCDRAGILREGRLIREDSVDKLTGTGIKRVTLQGASKLPEIDGIRDVKLTESGASFLYSGRADALIRALAALEFNDVTLTDPDVEDVFMHYYEKEGE
ncbi:MAG: ABC transporter ATP-binding protein [Clostridia bacterium]|jgi:ABC-2 type transport system ATP-binding protein|nr:ABC transporter ATP-binding protein [Clostridia bacterium]